MFYGLGYFWNISFCFWIYLVCFVMLYTFVCWVVLNLLLWNYEEIHLLIYTIKKPTFSRFSFPNSIWPINLENISVFWKGLWKFLAHQYLHISDTFQHISLPLTLIHHFFLYNIFWEIWKAISQVAPICWDVLDNLCTSSSEEDHMG